MQLRFYLKPVRKLGCTCWLAFAVNSAGQVVWQATAWSESGVRTAALKQQAKFKELNAAFKPQGA